MQTIKVKIKGNNCETFANVLFDTGADRTYISSELVDRIGPKFCKVEFISYCSFGSNKSNDEKLRNVYNLELFTNNGIMEVEATEVPIVCSPIFRRKIPYDLLNKFQSIEFVENYGDSTNIQIDILIGLDQYWNFFKSDIISLDTYTNNPEYKGLIAQLTVFGWILSGSYSTNSNVFFSHSHSCPLLCIQGVCDRDLKQIWDIDIHSDVVSDTQMLNKFEKENISFTDGRYEVSLPWLDSDKKNTLMSNYDLAENRLISLQKKLSKDPMIMF